MPLWSPPVPQVSRRGPSTCDAEGLLAHDAGHAGDLVDGLALEAEGGDEGAELGGGGLAGHDLVHDGGGLLLGEGRSRRPACAMAS